MDYIITAVISVIVGFIAGALVFRNNQQKIDAASAAIQSTVADIKTDAKKI